MPAYALLARDSEQIVICSGVSLDSSHSLTKLRRCFSGARRFRCTEDQLHSPREKTIAADHISKRFHRPDRVWNRTSPAASL